MFNLIMGYNAARATGADRMFEYTDADIKAFFAPGGTLNTSRLASLPALVLPELQHPEPPIARVGHVENLTLSRAEWRYRFVPNPAVTPIPINRIEEERDELQIEQYEGNRTHWAVKPVDLYRLLPALGGMAQVAPTVFELPIDALRDPELVAVMMPFDARYSDVYKTLQLAATDVGMTCQRADDIWQKPHIMDDIIGLIWRARVVIADFTGKNPNVFYEAGISHTIGRELVQITQSMDDIPFDLRSIRTLSYLNNSEGRNALRKALASRLQTILASS